EMLDTLDGGHHVVCVGRGCAGEPGFICRPRPARAIQNGENFARWRTYRRDVRAAKRADGAHVGQLGDPQGSESRSAAKRGCAGFLVGIARTSALYPSTARWWLGQSDSHW